MGYEYALLEKQKNRHTNGSWDRDHNEDYRQEHGKREIKQWSCWSFSNRTLLCSNIVSTLWTKPFLCQLWVQEGD